MSNLLRQSTAVVVSFGPFVSQTDGVTLKTGLVSAIDNGSTGIMLSKNGGTLAVRHASVTASTYDAYGNYKVTLDTTDTNTLGTLRMQFADATTNLVVFQDFQVVNTAIWDAFCASSGGAIPNVAAGANTGLPIVGTQVPNATAGAANGLLIAGSNAATTFAGLTTGALSCTTITASGAVAFQSTFAVTTSTSLAALSATTITASGTTSLAALTTSGTVTFNALTVSNATTLTGAVSLGSTLGVTGTTTLAALNTGAIGTGNLTITGTLSTSGTATLNALTISNATTLTGAVSATNGSNDIRGILLGANGSVALGTTVRTNGAAGTLPQLLNEILLNITEANNSGTTRTVNGYDHTTPVATYTYDNATPNTITRAT